MPQPSDASLDSLNPADHSQFAIGFDRRDLPRLHELWDGIVLSERWSEGELTERFESTWSGLHGLESVATGGWTGAALAALDFAGVRGEKVLCPSNTFMATPLSIIHSGGEPVFVDCNREDLCMSFEDFERKAEEHRPRAAVIVHIGGHIAFEVERIAEYCRANDIFLLEDCAHAHGASWNGRRAGSWGDAGAYSFYATKTISTGEGGMLVSSRDEIVEHAKAFRNYGKPDHQVEGLNLRMSEFTAAIGIVQTERLEEIVARKNEVARRTARPRVRLAPRASRRHDLGPLQVHRLRADRALDRQGLRRPVPPDHGGRRRVPQHRLGRAEPLVRAPLLRWEGARGGAEGNP